MQHLTVHDLIAGAIGMIALAGVVALAVLGEPPSKTLEFVVVAAVGYFMRGAQNGGLVPGRHKDEA